MLHAPTHQRPSILIPVCIPEGTVSGWDWPSDVMTEPPLVMRRTCVTFPGKSTTEPTMIGCAGSDNRSTVKESLRTLLHPSESECTVTSSTETRTSETPRPVAGGASLEGVATAAELEPS